MSTLNVPSLGGGSRAGMIPGLLLVAAIGGFLLWSALGDTKTGVRDQALASYYERHGAILALDRVEALKTRAPQIPCMTEHLNRALAQGCHNVREDCLTRAEGRFLRFYARWWEQRLEWAHERATSLSVG